MKTGRVCDTAAICEANPSIHNAHHNVPTTANAPTKPLMFVPVASLRVEFGNALPGLLRSA